jgi:molecular chaperone DnaK (HSP70)
VFDACYQRCVQAPADACKLGHDWCVLACRPGGNVGPRIVAAVVTNTQLKEPSYPTLLAHSVGIETLGGTFTPLIKRCTQLPAEISEVFSTSEDNQPSVEVTVLAGDAAQAKDNQLLGRFHLAGIRPAPRGVPQIQVTYRVAASGLLAVTAKDLKTGVSQTTSVSDR